MPQVIAGRNGVRNGAFILLWAPRRGTLLLLTKYYNSFDYDDFWPKYLYPFRENLTPHIATIVTAEKKWLGVLNVKIENHQMLTQLVLGGFYILTVCSHLYSNCSNILDHRILKLKKYDFNYCSDLSPF